MNKDNLYYTNIQAIFCIQEIAHDNLTKFSIQDHTDSPVN